VYGDVESSITGFSELDQTNKPVSVYAMTKKSLELLAEVYSNLYKIKMTGLRFFTVYGPNGRPDMAPYKFIHSIIYQKELTMYGDGTSMRDYTYIDDIVQGIILATVRQSTTHEIYNLGNSNPISLCNFIQLIESTVGQKAIIKHLPDQLGDVKLTYANISKAKYQLGYEPQISIDQGIRLTVDYYNKIIKAQN
jgi:UDP-glucuronate 4-epimerase